MFILSSSMACWSSGMLLALGAGGPGSTPGQTDLKYLFCYAVTSKITIATIFETI